MATIRRVAVQIVKDQLPCCADCQSVGEYRQEWSGILSTTKVDGLAHRLFSTLGIVSLFHALKSRGFENAGQQSYALELQLRIACCNSVMAGVMKNR